MFLMMTTRGQGDPGRKNGFCLQKCGFCRREAPSRRLSARGPKLVPAVCTTAGGLAHPIVNRFVACSGRQDGVLLLVRIVTRGHGGAVRSRSDCRTCAEFRKGWSRALLPRVRRALACRRRLPELDPQEPMPGAVIAGAAEVPYTRHPDDSTTTESLLAAAFRRVLAETDIARDEVDGLSVASFTLVPDHAIDLAWRLGLRLRWIMEDTNGGAAALNMLQHAIRAVEAGEARTVVLL